MYLIQYDIQLDYLFFKNQYQNYKQVKAARGIKIAAKDLEKSMAGLPLFVGRKDDEVEYFKNEIQNILKTALSSIKLKENGVYVQASTLGSLEALLEFLKTSNIPVGISFLTQWSVHSSLCFSMRVLTLVLFIERISFEHQLNLNEIHSKVFLVEYFLSKNCFVCRWAVVLAFDVRIEKDAQDHADNVGKLN